MKKAKQYYEKMTDFKQYARVMLAISAFFYLGVVIPTIEKSEADLMLMMGVTAIFLAGSILFLLQSKIYYKKLLEMDEGQDYLIKK
ncbi:hypothetical protein JMM81_01235 [Bacillus sp. V3B]|uniref:YrhC family protein n=1 Tax=Bacillus sp. V3B TaxID=2804915 RepID=UPI00210BA09B|nr:YrhC family protein [Bacillus sp. V3B]MCQ6273598.1 hypothetical protein [Bacillus sp. V3B]